MSVTRDTSHLEMSALKDVAPLNNPLMSVMRDTSHVLMAPNRLVVQAPDRDSARQVLTASLSSLVDFGRKTEEVDFVVIKPLHLTWVAKPFLSAVHSQSNPLS